MYKIPRGVELIMAKLQLWEGIQLDTQFANMFQVVVVVVVICSGLIGRSWASVSVQNA